MAGSVLGCFFYLSTAFAALMILLISLFDHSNALQPLRHYPRLVTVRTVTEAQWRLLKKAANLQASSDVGTNGASSPASIEPSQLFSAAKAKIEKSQRQRLADAHKIKMLARPRDSVTRALGYADEFSSARRPYGPFSLLEVR